MQLDNLVDFEKCCKTRIFLQKSVTIQPKTSNISQHFDKILAKFWPSPDLNYSGVGTPTRKGSCCSRRRKVSRSQDKIRPKSELFSVRLNLEAGPKDAAREHADNADDVLRGPLRGDVAVADARDAHDAPVQGPEVDGETGRGGEGGWMD